MRLAQQVGRPLSVVQREYDSRDFAMWLVYERMSPGAPERGDWQAGLVASTLMNLKREPHTEPLKAIDFVQSLATEFDTGPSEDEKEQVLNMKTKLEVSLRRIKQARKGKD